MSNKNRTPSAREKHNEDIINELFGNIENEPDIIDIETDIADLGQTNEEHVRTAPPPKRHKFFFVFAIFVIIMAIIGVISSVNFISDGMRKLVDNTSLKNEFARFLLPVVSNDIAPFENESEISNSAKVSCAIWNIMVNKNTDSYKSSVENEYLIPEYDVLKSCCEIFGAGTTITHQTVGTTDMRFTYDEENHRYSCGKNMRYLNYAPRIADMKENNGTYVLMVEYLPPSISMVSENLGIEVEPIKTMEYTVNRWNKTNTLMSVRLTGDGTGRE